MKRRSDSLEARLTPASRRDLHRWFRTEGLDEIVKLLQTKHGIKTSPAALSAWGSIQNGEGAWTELGELKKLAREVESMKSSLDKLIARLEDSA